MRFSYCKSLISKKSFYIYLNEYFFENEFNSLLLRQYGLSKFFKFFSYMLLEFHNSYLNINKTFLDIGLTKSRNLAKVILRYYQPHINIKNYFFINVLRWMKPNSLRGKNLVSGLPLHGQRTHSNRKNIQKFRSFLLNNISDMSTSNLYKLALRIKIGSLKNKEPKIEKVKKKTKLKSKPKGQKKEKKKKTNVWK